MRVARNDIEVRLEMPGAVIRQRGNFGEMPGLGRISAEYFTLAAGVDTTGLLQGLDGNHCPCQHWGYVLKGVLTTTDAQGRQETVRAHDLFYWPGGHNVRVSEDAEILMFSPEREHDRVIEHIREKVQAG